MHAQTRIENVARCHIVEVLLMITAQCKTENPLGYSLFTLVLNLKILQVRAQKNISLCL